MQATARMTSVVSSTLPARCRLIRGVRPRNESPLITILLSSSSKALSLLKQFFILLLSSPSSIVSPVLAKPPVVHDDIGKTLNVARKKDKMSIFISGNNHLLTLPIIEKIH